MSWVIYVFGTGVAFFLGVGLVLASVAAFARFERRGMKAVASLLALLGLMLVATSATPLSYWLYAIAGGLTFAWLVAERSGGWLSRRRTILRLAVVVVWLTALAVELPYHLPTTVDAPSNPTLYVIGDSVSAGMGNEKETGARRAHVRAAAAALL